MALCAGAGRRSRCAPSNESNNALDNDHGNLQLPRQFENNVHPSKKKLKNKLSGNWATLCSITCSLARDTDAQVLEHCWRCCTESDRHAIQTWTANLKVSVFTLNMGTDSEI